MRPRHPLFSKLAVTLAILLSLATLGILFVGVKVFRFSEHQVSVNANRNQALETALRLRGLWHQKKFDQFRDEMRSENRNSLRDQGSIYYLRNIERELSKKKPDLRNITALVEGWQAYQSVQGLRSVDDFQDRLSGLTFYGWLIWIALLTVLLLISLQIAQTVLKPISYLSNYFSGTQKTSELGPLFPCGNSRELSGVDDAAPEVSRLFLRLEEVIIQAAEFRKLNVAQFIEQKSRAQLLSRASRDAVFLFRDGVLRWCNSIGVDLIGIPEGSFKEGHFVGEYKDIPSSDFYSQVLSSLESPAPREVSVYCDKFGDDCFYLLSSLSLDLVRDHTESQYDAVIIAQDVTWFRQVERAKSHFMGLLSHEVKTPLTSLLMATRLLQKSDQSRLMEVQKRLVDSSVNDVTRLCALIDELFSASRYQLNQEKLNMSRVNVRRVVLQAIRSVQADADLKSISISFIGIEDRDVPYISADASRLLWAVSQVLGSCIRSSEKDSRVTVRLELVRSESLTEFEITVNCFGWKRFEGLSSRVSEKNFSEYDIRVGRSSSTGMGFAIAREIMKGHGGTLSMHSGLNSELEITFRLPTTGTDGFQIKNPA